jgi:hypothetical protein
MALFPFPVSLTACFVFVVLLHKMLALLMLGSLGNIFGLPGESVLLLVPS